MRIRTSRRSFVAAASLLVLTAFAFWGYSLSGFEADNDRAPLKGRRYEANTEYVAAGLQARESERGIDHKGGFEVWIADQSDTRPGFGGQLLIYEGSSLMGSRASRARPIVRLDLGADTADLCRASTGRNPVRPHMVLFNNQHTHA